MMLQRQTEQDQSMAQIMADMYGHMDRPPRPVDGRLVDPTYCSKSFKRAQKTWVSS